MAPRMVNHDPTFALAKVGHGAGGSRSFFVGDAADERGFRVWPTVFSFADRARRSVAQARGARDPSGRSAAGRSAALGGLGWRRGPIRAAVVPGPGPGPPRLPRACRRRCDRWWLQARARGRGPGARGDGQGAGGPAAAPGPAAPPGRQLDARSNAEIRERRRAAGGRIGGLAQHPARRAARRGRPETRGGRERRRRAHDNDAGRVHEGSPRRRGTGHAHRRRPDATASRPPTRAGWSAAPTSRFCGPHRGGNGNAAHVPARLIKKVIYFEKGSPALAARTCPTTAWRDAGAPGRLSREQRNPRVAPARDDRSPDRQRAGRIGAAQGERARARWCSALRGEYLLGVLFRGSWPRRRRARPIHRPKAELAPATATVSGPSAPSARPRRSRSASTTGAGADHGRHPSQYTAAACSAGWAAGVSGGGGADQRGGAVGGA